MAEFGFCQLQPMSPAVLNFIWNLPLEYNILEKAGLEQWTPEQVLWDVKWQPGGSYREREDEGETNPTICRP